MLSESEDDVIRVKREIPENGAENPEVSPQESLIAS